MTHGQAHNILELAKQYLPPGEWNGRVLANREASNEQFIDTEYFVRMEHTNGETPPIMIVEARLGMHFVFGLKFAVEAMKGKE